MFSFSGAKIFVTIEFLDYIFFNSYIILMYFIYGEEKFTVLASGIIFLIFFAMIIAHDHIYYLLFPDILCQAKINYKITKSNYQDMVKIIIFYFGLMMAETYFDHFHLQWKGLLQSSIEFAFEFWFMSLVKDFTLMRYLHKWMHEKKGWYWLHKQHHETNENVQIVTTFHFDILDIIIENAGAPITLHIFYYFFREGCPAINYASFLYLGWADSMIHSLNPYTVVFFNPIWDYFMKGVIAHNLHHMVQENYYELVPFRHFIKGEIEKDLKKI